MSAGPVHLSVAPGQRSSARPSRTHATPSNAGWRLIVQLTATVLLLIAMVAGVGLGTGPATLTACAALLVLGLPHGSFDMLLLVQAAHDGRRRLAAMLLLYLGLGAAMAALWWALPLLALTSFLVMAAIHFAEDWHDVRSAFVAQGIALAIIAAPALFHHQVIADLLGIVATAKDGVLVGAALTTVAPVAVVVAFVGLAMTALSGARAHAAGGFVAIVALLALPPLVGFALFFCLLHSPLHFAQARRESGRDAWRQWVPVVVPVTLLAMGVAGALYLLAPTMGVSANVIQTSFRTLSILTLPHVAVPLIVRRWRTMRGTDPRARA